MSNHEQPQEHRLPTVSERLFGHLVLIQSLPDNVYMLPEPEEPEPPLPEAA